MLLYEVRRSELLLKKVFKRPPTAAPPPEPSLEKPSTDVVSFPEEEQETALVAVDPSGRFVAYFER